MRGVDVILDDIYVLPVPRRYCRLSDAWHDWCVLNCVLNACLCVCARMLVFVCVYNDFFPARAALVYSHVPQIR